METARNKNVSSRAEALDGASGPPRAESGAVPTAETRRAHPRHGVEIEVTLESESNFYLGLTENLSEGGLFIATHVWKPIGTQVAVAFKLPHVAESLKLSGTVRWVREYSETSDTSPGMGVRFEHISPQQVDQIREFLATRAPLFYDED